MTTPTYDGLHPELLKRLLSPCGDLYILTYDFHGWSSMAPADAFTYDVAVAILQNRCGWRPPWTIGWQELGMN